MWFLDLIAAPRRAVRRLLFSHVIRIVGNATLLSLCLLSSCTSPTFQIPALSQSDQVPLGDPARDAQARLLAEAHRAFAQARYPTAVLFFTRFIERAPDSRHAAEARWWLGQAHEQLGDYAAAMQEYRIVAAGALSARANSREYETQALRRLDELRGRQAADRTSGRRPVAVRLPAASLPAESAITAWLRDLSSAGVTALVIDADPLPATERERRPLQRAKQVIAEAHQLGLLVWMTFDVHRPQGIGVRPDWLSVTSNGAASASTPDVTNIGYQAYLEKVLRELLDTGCDGIFVPARPTDGFAAEFSEGGFRAFAASFEPSLSPQDLFSPGPSSDGSPSDRTVWYWRWVGWKAASYAKFLVSLAAVLRAGGTPRALLLEVHQETLLNPLEGLERYGEDVVELVRRTGGTIIVRREAADGEVLIEKLGQQLGAPDRLWTEILPRASGDPFSAASLRLLLGEQDEAGRRSLLIAPQLVPAVP
ncbi:hypothetical protein NITMOv2_1818 [Nitrospira moscoviensis]|uniref:Tetratricopeptide repeat protein n=1 Tax=Nitrospira moscoviensis TaxID=42253 RepID=A0A0K2GBB6_NITMO|nr:hypothetical protein NITMOv2_1818 [Nitrospira moscoviensis]